MKTCRRCGKSFPASAFIAGKAKRVSTSCAGCRKAAAAKHVRSYFASLPPDERHTKTHKRRAEAAGVAHIPYSRTAIMIRWKRKCCYCDERATHLDHVTPIAKGGADVESNMVPACAGCNLSKGAKTLAEWAQTF